MPYKSAGGGSFQLVKEQLKRKQVPRLPSWAALVTSSTCSSSSSSSSSQQQLAAVTHSRSNCPAASVLQQLSNSNA
jgi:hypothetical protein